MFRQRLVLTNTGEEKWLTYTKQKKLIVGSYTSYHATHVASRRLRASECKERAIKCEKNTSVHFEHGLVEIHLPDQKPRYKRYSLRPGGKFPLHVHFKVDDISTSYINHLKHNRILFQNNVERFVFKSRSQRQASHKVAPSLGQIHLAFHGTDERKWVNYTLTSGYTFPDRATLDLGEGRRTYISHAKQGDLVYEASPKLKPRKQSSKPNYKAEMKLVLPEGQHIWKRFSICSGLFPQSALFKWKGKTRTYNQLCRDGEIKKVHMPVAREVPARRGFTNSLCFLESSFYQDMKR